MKKLSIYLSVLLPIFFLIHSNNVVGQEFKMGFQLGMTATQVTGDQLSGFSKAGLFGGLRVSRALGNYGAGQMEINFIQKGSRLNAKPDKGLNNSYLLRLNYMEVPVSYRLRLNKFFGIEGGAKFAYLINTRERDENGDIPDEANKPDFNKFDISVFTGVVYEINDKWSFVIRYAYSVKSFRPKPDNSYVRYDDGQFNETLCTAFQYKF